MRIISNSLKPGDLVYLPIKGSGFIDVIKPLNIIQRFLNWLFSCKHSLNEIFEIPTPYGVVTKKVDEDLVEIKTF